MIYIKLIRENPDVVRNGLRLRGASEDSLKIRTWRYNELR